MFADAMAAQTLHVTPGDAIGWSWTFKDSDDGEAFDFTGWSVDFVARDKASNVVVIATADVTVTLSPGLVEIALPSTLTATLDALAPFGAKQPRLAWALRLISPTAGEDEIPAGGDLVITPNPYYVEES